MGSRSRSPTAPARVLPGVILLVGLLGLVGAYEELKEFLAASRPGAVIDTIDLVQQKTRGTRAPRRPRS